MSQGGKNEGGYNEEGSKQILQKYLYRLINTGYIEDEKIDGVKAKLYRPIKDLQYSFYSFSDDKNIFPYKLKMKVEDSNLFPTKKMLELHISESLKCSSKYSEIEKLNFKLVGTTGDEISIGQLVDRYFGNPDDYFICLDEKSREEKASKDVKQNTENKQGNSSTLKQGYSEEYISDSENSKKLQYITGNNENNTRGIYQTLEENVLLKKKEQIEYSDSSVKRAAKNLVLRREQQDTKDDLECVYENDDADEATLPTTGPTQRIDNQ